MGDGTVLFHHRSFAATLALAAIVLAGCDGDAPPSASAPPPPKVDPPEKVERVVKAEPAPEKKPPARQEPVIEEMMKRLQPGTDPGREAQNKEQEGKLLAEAESLIRAILKELDADDLAALQVRLIPKEDLEAIVSDGMKRILVGNLLPENHRVLQALVESCRGKDLTLKTWAPGKLQTTRSGSTYKVDVPLLSNSLMEISSAGESTPVSVDFVHRGGKWLVFRIARRN